MNNYGLIIAGTLYYDVHIIVFVREVLKKIAEIFDFVLPEKI